MSQPCAAHAPFASLPPSTLCPLPPHPSTPLPSPPLLSSPGLGHAQRTAGGHPSLPHARPGGASSALQAGQCTGQWRKRVWGGAERLQTTFQTLFSVFQHAFPPYPSSSSLPQDLFSVFEYIPSHYRTSQPLNFEFEYIPCPSPPSLRTSSPCLSTFPRASAWQMSWPPSRGWRVRPKGWQ